MSLIFGLFDLPRNEYEPDHEELPRRDVPPNNCPRCHIELVDDPETCRRCGWSSRPFLPDTFLPSTCTT